MEEIITLRKYLQEHRYDEALLIALELEDMSRDDKINRIASYAEILLLHVIKQDAERRTTRSWDLSVGNALAQISRTNKRRKAGGYYLDNDELREALNEAYYSALLQASGEAFEGQFTSKNLLYVLIRVRF
jgi:hypothetical protein